MNNKNIKLLDKMIQAFRDGDINLIDSLLARDAIWIVPYSPDDVFSGVYHGKTEIMDLFSSLGGVIELQNYTVEQYLANTETVIAIGHKTINHLLPKRQRKLNFIYKVKIKEDKIILFDTYQRDFIENEETI